MNSTMSTESTSNSPAENPHSWDVNYSVAFLRSVPTAVLSSLITNPIKIWQFKKTINEPATFQHIMKTAPMRAAHYSMGIHFLSSMIIFNGVPLTKKCLQHEEYLSPEARHLLAFGIAGVVDSLIVSRPNVYLQKIYASSLTAKPKAVFELLQPKEIQTAWRASSPFYALGAGIFYSVWGYLVRKSEKELLVQEQKATVSKGIEEFMIGGISAVVSSAASYPINSFGNRRAHTPNLTIVQDFTHGWERFGALKEYGGTRILFQHYYRGFSVNLVRAPVAMGIFNLCKFFGDEMYKQCGLFAAKNKQKSMIADEENLVAFLERISPS